jgi:hypothetical protein
VHSPDLTRASVCGEQGFNCGACICGQFQVGKWCFDRLGPLQVQIAKPSARPGATVQVKVTSLTFHITMCLVPRQ